MLCYNIYINKKELSNNRYNGNNWTFSFSDRNEERSLCRRSNSDTSDPFKKGAFRKALGLVLAIVGLAALPALAAAAIASAAMVVTFWDNIKSLIGSLKSRQGLNSDARLKLAQFKNDFEKLYKLYEEALKK